MSITRTKKTFKNYREPFIETPNLIEAQLESYQWFVRKGIGEVLKEFSPIED
jgi:DNA-directed RNA polymerase subunit beta